MARRTYLVFIAGLLALAVAAGCDALPALPGAEEPTPTRAPARSGPPPVVSATGEVVPADWSTLSFITGGDIVELSVEEGDPVEAGDVIAHLDDADLRVAVSQAEASVAEAEANLARAKAGPTEEEIAAAESALQAAYARTSAAAARRDALYEPPTEAELTEAQNRLTNAQIEFDQARSNLQELINFDEDDCRWYETYDLECPLARFQPVSDYAKLAELQLQAAQAYLDEVQRDPDPEQVRVENARIWIASAQAEAAKARLAFLEAQPFPEEIAVAEAELMQARAALEAAEARTSQAALEAPFDATVTAVYAAEGEFVGPGQPVAQLGDLGALRVETTDLNEIDVARVEVGDEATVTFDALPDLTLSGTVVAIAPRAEAGTGVNYTVTVELEEVPAALRWGMTAFVDIAVE